MSEIGVGFCNESGGSSIIVVVLESEVSLFRRSPFVDVVVQHAYHESALKKRGSCGMEGAPIERLKLIKEGLAK